MKEKNISFPIIVKSKKIEIGMHSKTGADKGYIQGRKSQLKNYNNQYNDFLKKTGRTKRSGATWIATTNPSSDKLKKQTKKINSNELINSNKQNSKIDLSNTLSNEELYSINKYIGFESYLYNEKLRNGILLTEEETKILDNLDNALSKMPKYNNIVTRSVSINSEDIDYFLNDYKVGSIVTHKAYTSATKGDIYNPEARIQMVIKSKKGRDISIYNEPEQEILFVRDSKFKVKKVDKSDEFYVKIELEEV